MSLIYRDVHGRSGKAPLALPVTIAIVVAVAIGLYFGTKSTKSGVKGQPSVGQQAPEIVGLDLDGKEFRLSDYRGKVVMLDFWGNW